MSASPAGWRTSQSASTRLSASVVAYQVRESWMPPIDLAYAKPAARGTHIADVEVSEMHIGAEPARQPRAAVITGIVRHDDQPRRRQAHRGGQHRPQAPRQQGRLVVRRNHHHNAGYSAHYISRAG
jgi:hypothetical protein